MRYNIGDLVADPITNTLGIVYGVFEAHYSTVYRVEWQDEQMNQRKKQDWDYYELCRITKNVISQSRRKQLKSHSNSEQVI